MAKIIGQKLYDKIESTVGKVEKKVGSVFGSKPKAATPVQKKAPAPTGGVTLNARKRLLDGLKGKY